MKMRLLWIGLVVDSFDILQPVNEHSCLTLRWLDHLSNAHCSSRLLLDHLLNVLGSALVMLLLNLMERLLKALKRYISIKSFG